jgi:hypothetical protein
MVDSTPSRHVGDKGADRTPELVVEGDARREAEQACRDAHAQARERARTVALEREPSSIPHDRAAFGCLTYGGTSAWGGWLSIPHTSSLVLLMSAATLFVVATTGRALAAEPAGRPVGAAIAIFGFIAASGLLFRILEPPFSAAGGDSTQVGSVAIELGGWPALASAVLVLIAGIVHAALHRKEEHANSRAREERPGAAVPGRN